MQTLRILRKSKCARILLHQKKTACWLLIVCMAWLCCSCATWAKSKISQAEIDEFHGDHHVFWPYANAGFVAANKRDWTTSQHWYLRAYRNTGMSLASREDSPSKSFMFGLSADVADAGKIEAYALKLDELTPLPGTGGSTNDILDTAMNYQRSLAAYNWARAAGRLGEYEAAEQAFLYSLQLEKIRSVPEKDKLVASRYYELAWLYHAWGKQKESIQCYRDALAATDKRGIRLDPIGFAAVLDEFASYLSEAGQHSEADDYKKQSDELRKANPGSEAKFILEPYPVLKR